MSLYGVYVLHKNHLRIGFLLDVFLVFKDFIAIIESFQLYFELVTYIQKAIGHIYFALKLLYSTLLVSKVLQFILSGFSK